MAFLQGMTSASITFHVTRACGSGEVVECGCAQSKGRKHSKNSGIEDWAWGGCSDNIRYGMYFTRDFIDTTDNGASDNSGANLMMQHNYESGLRVRFNFIISFSKKKELVACRRFSQNSS